MQNSDLNKLTSLIYNVMIHNIARIPQQQTKATKSNSYNACNIKLMCFMLEHICWVSTTGHPFYFRSDMECVTIFCWFLVWPERVSDMIFKRSPFQFAGSSTQAVFYFNWVGVCVCSTSRQGRAPPLVTADPWVCKRGRAPLTFQSAPMNWLFDLNQ